MSRDSTKKNLAQHYKREEILKNKIANTDRLVRNKRQNRVLPSLPSKPADVEEYSHDYVEEKPSDKSSFFATEPGKRKRVQSQSRQLK